MADERWQEIKTIWKQNQWLYVLAGFIAGLLVEPLLQLVATDVVSFLQTLVPEAIGIVFTVLFIDRLYRRREEQREERDLKARLIRELGSSVNEVAKRAAEELRVHGWLEDGSLRTVKLGKANLQGTNLSFSELPNVVLWEVELQGADLTRANLRKSILGFARMQGANLYYCDLQGAMLEFASLQGAVLVEANLQNVTFESSEFDEDTLLPDDTYWTPGTDMRRFTDPTHPDFWCSDDPASPAWRGKEE